jgi:hypothetical protein
LFASALRRRGLFTRRLQIALERFHTCA